jgi:predicted PurR-regulated permease PerM
MTDRAAGSAAQVDSSAGSVDGRPTDRSSSTVSVVPPWLVNLSALGLRVLAVAALLVAVGYLAAILWVVTASIIVSIVIAALFAPYVLRLRNGGRSRAAAAAIVWVVAMVVLIAVVVVLALVFVPYIADALSWLQAGVEKLQADLAELQVPPIVGNLVHDLVGLVRQVLTNDGGGLVSTAASVVTVMILATFLVFFFLKDGDKAWVWLFQAVSEQKRERITEAGDDALTRVGGYLRGTTVLSAIIATTDFLFMWILGVPMAGPLAVLVFLAGYIPYFGGLVTTLLILLVAYAALGPVSVVILLLLIAIRNAILGYTLRPMIYGRSVNLHPALVLLVLPAGYSVAGVIGLFAAVPLTAVVFAVARATVAIIEPDPRPPLPGLVPAWLDRVAQWSWRLLVAGALASLVIALFVTIPLVLIPVLIALILAATLDPLVTALVRRGRSRGMAALIAVAGSSLVIIGLIVLAVAVLAEQVGEIATTTQSGATAVDSTAGGYLGAGSAAVSAGLIQIVGTVLDVARSVSSLALISIFSVLLAFYLLRDGGRLWARAVGRVRPEVAPEVEAAGRRAFDVLGGYMTGTAAISFVGAGSQFVIMVLLGIPLALPVFVLSFFLCFIPYIGGFVSTGLAFLLTVAAGSTADIVIMGLWTLVFNIVTGNVVGPLVYGRTVHLHPAIVLVAIPAGSAIAGMLGMFIVIPIIGVVSATWRTVLEILGAGSSAAPEVPEVSKPPPTEAPVATDLEAAPDSAPT